MAGLVRRAAGADDPTHDPLERAKEQWESSMLGQLGRLRAGLLRRPPSQVASYSGAIAQEAQITFDYWDRSVSVGWPALRPALSDGTLCSTLDAAMLLYYLSQADGTPPAGRWIGFRDLPAGAFYHQAFQGYSGDRIRRAFESDPNALGQAAFELGGWSITDLGSQAYAFQPLPLVRLAAAFWPGDDEVPSRATVLFDEAASHHLPTDGLALLGAGLTTRLLARRANGTLGR